MPDLKISDMVAATQALAADLFPVVQAGMNLKQTRDIFLRAVSGETIALRGTTSQVFLDAFGNVQISVTTAQSIAITAGTSGQIMIQVGTQVYANVLNGEFDIAAGDNLLQLQVGSGINGQAGAGETVFLTDNNGSGFFADGVKTVGVQGVPGTICHFGNDLCTLDLLDDGNVVFALPGATPMTVPYNTANPSDWVTSPPATYEDALNRIAVFLKSTLGPIP